MLNPGCQEALIGIAGAGEPWFQFMLEREGPSWRAKRG